MTPSDLPKETAASIDRLHLFVGGDWLTGEGASLAVASPATGAVIARGGAASPEQVGAAVWGGLAGSTRCWR